MFAQKNNNNKKVQKSAGFFSQNQQRHPNEHGWKHQAQTVPRHTYHPHRRIHRRLPRPTRLSRSRRALGRIRRRYNLGLRQRDSAHRRLFFNHPRTDHHLHSDGRHTVDDDKEQTRAGWEEGRVRRERAHVERRRAVCVAGVRRLEDEHPLVHVHRVRREARSDARRGRVLDLLHVVR